MIECVKVVVFDADDTLWENETRFRAAERKVGDILEEYVPFEEMSSSLYSIEVKNMPDYGFGAMAFTLSMLENAVKVSEGKLNAGQVADIIEVGRDLLHNPSTPFEGVADTLRALRDSGLYKLVCVTKGDLLDQGHKLDRSGLRPFFDHVEIVAGKSRKEYSELCEKLRVSPSELFSVGNSFKSDIAPVLEIGGAGAHVPFHVTWELEKTEEYEHPRLFKIESLSELKGILL